MARPILRSTFVLVAVTPLVVTACTRKKEEPSSPRDPVAPVWAVSTLPWRETPDPACTCATIESFPPPTGYEAECEGRLSVCGDIHYEHFIKRKPGLPARDTVATLLDTPFVESRIYDAMIEMAAPASGSYVEHVAHMRVHRGDVIPTALGRARVVQITRSFVEDETRHYDDGKVQLHFFERFPADTTHLLYVSSGAPSELDGRPITVVRASGGEADIVMDGATSMHVKKGDVVTVAHGSFPVVEVVDGRTPGPLGWIAIDTRFER